MKNDSGVRTESPDEIVEHISRLMAEAESMMAGPVAEGASEKLNELRERFSDLQAKASNLYSDARRKVVAGARATDETIRTHPYESLALALGVGVLLGALIRRGNS